MTNIGDQVFFKGSSPPRWLGKITGLCGGKIEIMTPYGSHVLNENEVDILHKEEAIMLKVFLEEKKAGGVIIGVSKDGCDPIVTTREGDINQGLTEVPEILKDALGKWATEPRNPAFTAPAPVTKPKTKKTEEKKPDTGSKAAPPAATTPEGDNPLLVGIASRKKPDETPVTQDLPLLADKGAEDNLEAGKDTEEGSGSGVATNEGGPLDPEQASQKETEGNPTVRTCRICGCTDDNACEGGCTWVEDDLCSNCINQTTEETGTETETGDQAPGLYLKDGRGPFDSVQQALDALGVPAEDRPHHNRYDRLSNNWKERIIRRD